MRGLNEDEDTSLANGSKGINASQRILPVIEETIHVEKRLIERGGIRLTKTVTARDETIDEALLTTEFSVERREIGQLVAPDATPSVRIEGDTTIYPVLKEVLITEKRLMLVAEVHVRRIESHFHEPQTISLRKEDIHVERIADGLIPAAKQS